MASGKTRKRIAGTVGIIQAGRGEREGSTPVALTIAGSDSGGGAGIQADLKTFAALGVYGVSAITTITAQNPERVAGIQPVDPQMVSLQIRTVVDSFPVSAVKTGMLYSARIIRAVSLTLAKTGIRHVVVDPVMVAGSGARLLQPDAVAELCRSLIPLATVITPNRAEAECLWGRNIESLEAQERAARELSERFGTACVVKGGHLSHSCVTGESVSPGHKRRGRRPQREEVVDVLCQRGKIFRFRACRVALAKTHGTGCTFSAAIAAWLARGADLPDAVKAAQEFVVRALDAAREVGKHCVLQYVWDGV